MRNKKVIAGTVIVAIVVIVAIGIVVFPTKKASQTQSDAAAPAATSSNTSSSSTPTTSASKYKDGTYTATGSYDSPGGNESVTVSLTVKDDAVTDSSATSGANDPTAKQYQAEFINGYKTLVVGKSLDSIQVSRVSGSSLTSQGFNAAVTRIKTQAKA